MLSPQNKKIMSAQTNVRQVQIQVSSSALMVGSGVPDMIEAVHLKGFPPKYHKKAFGWFPVKLTVEQEKAKREQFLNWWREEILELVPKLMKWVNFHLDQESLEPLKFILEFNQQSCTPDEIDLFPVRSAILELKENYKQELKENYKQYIRRLDHLNTSVISLQRWEERIDLNNGVIVGKMRKHLLSETKIWFEKFQTYFGEYLNAYYEKYGSIYVPRLRIKRMQVRFPTVFQPLNSHCFQNQQGLYENCKLPLRSSKLRRWFQEVESDLKKQRVDQVQVDSDLDQVEDLQKQVESSFEETRGGDDEPEFHKSLEEVQLQPKVDLDLETQTQRSFEVQTEVRRVHRGDDEKVDGLNQEEAHKMEQRKNEESRRMIIRCISNGGLKNGDMQQKEMNQKEHQRKMSLSLSPKKEVEEEKRDEEKKDEEKRKQQKQLEEFYEARFNELQKNQNKDKPKPKVGDLLMLRGDLSDKAAPENAEKTINPQYPYALVQAVYEDSVELTSSDMNASKKSQENLEKERRDAQEKVIWSINSDEDLNIFKTYFKTVSSLAERKDRWYREIEEKEDPEME